VSENLVECPGCGKENPDGSGYCESCWRELAAGSGEIRELVGRSRQPLYAALLFAGAGALDLVSAFTVFSVEDYLQDFYSVDVTGAVYVCGGLIILFACSAFIAAFMSYRRGSFSVTMAAGILGILGLGPFFLGGLMSIIGIVFVAMNRGEFL